MLNSTHIISRRSILGGVAAAVVTCVAPVALAAEPSLMSAGKNGSSRAAPQAAKLRTTKATSSPKSSQAAAAEISAIVKESLGKNPYYFPGALISRGDVSPILAKLLAQGLTETDDQEDLYGSILSDQSPLVKRLKTPAGRAFMKKIVTDKTAYDRLEWLSWTAEGRKLLESFVNSKDGYEKFQKLQTAADLARVSKQLAADPHTADFGQPTGHILTADALVLRLQERAGGRDNPQKSDESSAAR